MVTHVCVFIIRMKYQTSCDSEEFEKNDPGIVSAISISFEFGSGCDECQNVIAKDLVFVSKHEKCPVNVSSFTLSYKYSNRIL